MRAVTVELPIPTSTNRMYLHTRTGPVKTPRARSYKLACLAACRREGITAPFLGPVRVSLIVYRKWRRGDLDNFLKVLLDSLQGLTYHKDSRVRVIDAELNDEQRRHPRVVVTVEEMP